MRNKGQIASTLTWIVAFFIIFFIILLFTATTVVLAGKKRISGDMYIENVPYTSDYLKNQRDLIYFLNSESDGKTIKELIVNWVLLKDEDVKQKIEQEIEVFLNERAGEEDCYVFHVEYGKNPNVPSYKLYERTIINERLFKQGFDPENVDEKNKRREFLLKRTSGVKLLEDTEIKFYFGRCLQ